MDLPSDNYDAWQDAYMRLLDQYADCAVRHSKTVLAWPK